MTRSFFNFLPIALRGKWALGPLMVLVLAMIVGLTSQFGLVRVNHSIDLSQTSEAGMLYRNPIASIYAPLVTVAQPEAAAMRVTIDGETFSCSTKGPELSVRGAGQCVYQGTYLAWSRPDDLDPRTAEGNYEVSYAVQAERELLYMLALAVGYFLFCAFYVDRLSRLALSLGAASMVLGGLLMTANLVGLALPLRSPMLTTIESSYGPGNLRYSYEQAQARIAWRDDDTPARFARRVNDAIEGAVLHAWSQEHFPEVRMHIPIWENWFLRGLGMVRPEYREYIFWDPHGTIERGYGTCGHVSSAFVGIMREHRIDARMVTLFGHVLATAEVEPGVWHLFDPDFNVTIPHSLDVVEQREDLLRSYYRPAFERMRRHTPPTRVQAFQDAMIRHFLKTETNHIDELGRASYHSGHRLWGLNHGEVEALAYRIKWWAPTALLFAGGLVVASVWRWRRGAGDIALQNPAEDAVAASSAGLE